MRDQKKKKKGDGAPSFGKMNWDKYSHYAAQDFFIFLICVICFVEGKKKGYSKSERFNWSTWKKYNWFFWLRDKAASVF